MTCFNWIDYVLTQKLFKMGAKELNPVAKILNMFWAKLVGNVAIIIAAIFMHWVILVIPTALFLFACIWNAVQYARSK
jgi:hypothetical protein